MTLCRYLDWDSAFFGKRIGTVTPSMLDRQQMESVLAWSRSNAIDCLYFCANADHAESGFLAQAAGFDLVGIRVTLDCALNDDTPPATPRLRPYQPGDLETLRQIARISYTGSRFFVDPHFPRERCEALYDVWITRSCTEDYADHVLVAVQNGLPVGYITCHLPQGDAPARIGLVGVAASAQGLGLGRELVLGALAWFQAHGVEYVSVVTQGSNISAQRLYQRAGFRTSAVSLWYHRWFW